MPQFKLTACTANHIGDRPEQQDRVAVFTSNRSGNTLLAVLADGMGGRSGGRMASDQVMITAEQLFRDFADSGPDSLRALLQQISAEAHAIIRLSALTSDKEPHSTIAMLAVRSECAVWAHAGDSRLYLFRDGRLLHRTADQTYAAKLEADGRALEAAAFKHMLTSALGVEKGPTLVVNELQPLKAGDTFFLCSDGVWAYFDDGELASALLGLTPREAAKRVVKLARTRARSHGDNLSLAVVRLDALEDEGAKTFRSAR